MRPTLYLETASDFTTNGLGGLSDCISCVVTEERNGNFELELVYPVTGAHYSDIAVSRIIKAESNPQGTPQLFRIYGITKPLNGKVTVNAEHISYQLSYIPVAPYTARSVVAALQGLSNNAMTSCPFTFWTDKETVADYKQEVPENIRARLGGISGSILDVYGGEYEFDNYTVKLHNHRGSDRGVTLRYGKNITDIEQEENIASTYTSVVAFWKGTDEVVYTPTIDSEHSASFPFKRVKIVDFSSDYEEKPTVQTLTARATAYMNANGFGIPKVNIKVSFIALDQTEEYKNIAPLERVYLCDTLTVLFEKLGISATAKVVKTVYDVLKGRYESLEVGEARTNLSHKFVETDEMISEMQDDTLSEMEKAIDNATKRITGEKGGYIVDRYNANGERYEILIMDTNDVNTARKVWRWNLSGWGYSSTGINGPYRLAATQDGAIVADFITVGTLTANLIRAGVLQDVNGYNYWDMRTGEFRLISTATIGGKAIASTDYADNVANTAENNAKTFAATTANSVAQALNRSLDQQEIFNRLTNNGTVQGIIMSNGQLYINATYINTGTLAAELIKAGILSDSQGYNYWNMNTGEFSLRAGATIGGTAIASTADAASAAATAATAAAGTAISAYDTQLNQMAVFNKLTNNGAAQGITMDINGDLYINASYIAAGILSDPNQNTVFNLSSGALSAKKLSVTSTNFTLQEDGTLSATNANLSGKVTAASGSSKAVLDSGRLDFMNGSTVIGEIQADSTAVFMGAGTTIGRSGFVAASASQATLGFNNGTTFREVIVDANGVTVRGRVTFEEGTKSANGHNGANGFFYDRDGNQIEVEDGLIVNTPWI